MSAPAAELVARLRGALDRDGALDLLTRSVNTPSVTGTEGAFAGLLAGELKALKAEGVTLRDFAPGRPNAWGRRAGTDGAGNILLIGHTDTVHVRGWEKHWTGTERESPFSAAVVEGRAWGRGSSDMKAGLCTAISAVRTLDRAGVPLGPSVTFAFVGDEESGEPGSGISAGARTFSGLVKAGDVPRPDFAIYFEPTMLDVYVAHMGFYLCNVTVTGKSAYFGVPELGVDALKATHRILATLWDYSDGLKSRPEHPLVGHGFVLVTGIAGGGYIAVPGECTFGLIVKVPPGEDLGTSREELERTIRGAVDHPEVQVAFRYTTARDHAIGGTPFETADTPALARLADAIKAVRPEHGRIEAAPYWSELPFLAALGVPGVYFAPGDIRICHTLGENVIVEDYYDGIVALAAFLADPSSLSKAL